MSAFPHPARFVVGLDLGKLQDYTALAILEERPGALREDLPRARTIPVWDPDPDFDVRHLQRWPLGTAYHRIAADVDGLVGALLGRVPRPEVALFADGTGVGEAVLEMLRRQPTLGALGLAAVVITAGGEATRSREGGGVKWRVGKADLVASAQTTLQRGKLRVAAGLPEAATLTAELRNFEARLTPSANVVYTAREGQHDDLVLAVAIALWGATRPRHESHCFNYRTAGRGVAPYGKNMHRREYR